MGDRRHTGDQKQPGNSSQSQDWVALDWVRGEITDTLTQARQSLEAYVDNPQDDTRLRFCQNYIHQIHGTLEMVEFYGAALLAEEMEGLTQALLDDALPDRDEALEVLMQAILQLPPYLEQVQAGRRDIPVVILPVLNDLRSARGESLLSETSLFSPDLSGMTAEVTDEELSRMDSVSLLQLLKKLRQMYQFALVGFFKDPSDKTSLEYLVRVFDRMASLCQGLPAADIWPVTHALVQSLVSGNVRNNPAVRNLLRQVDRVLEALISGGPTAFNRTAPDDLLKNSLYYIARSTSEDDQTCAIKRQYRLDSALPDEETVTRERERLSGPDREAMGSVVCALSEELMAVKDALDLYVRNPEASLDTLAEQLPALRQVGDTLAVLGLGIPRKIILEQVDALSGMVNSQSHDDNQLMDIAGSLLYVEATLSGIANEQHNDGAAGDESADLRSARRSVVQEACSGLGQAKEAIVDFTASDWDKSCLKPVPEILASVRGSLAMIDQERVSALVSSASHYVEKVLLSSDERPAWSNMELFADVLAGAEYYLERMVDGVDEQGESILDLACESLEQLESLSSVATEQSSNDELVLDEEDELEFTLEDIELDTPDSPSVSTVTAPSVDEIDLEIPDLDLVGLEDDVEEFHATGESAVSENAVEESATSEINITVEDDSDDDLDEELVEIFAEEAGEVRELLAEHFPRWQADQTDQHALTEFRRAFHTLKGSGRMVGATVVGELGWAIENMLNRVIEGTVNSSDAMVALVEKVIGLLPALVEDFANNRQHISADVQQCMDEADAWSRGETPVSAVDSETAESVSDVADEVFEIEGLEIEELELEGPESESVQASENEEDIVLDLSDFSIETPETPSPTDVTVSQLDSELVAIFSKESTTHLESINDFVEQFNESTEDSLTISDDLQRALHTLKGSAGMAGVTQVAELVSAIERMMKEFRSLGIPADEVAISLLARSSLLVQEGIQQVDAGTDSSIEIEGAAELIKDVETFFEERTLAENMSGSQEESAEQVRVTSLTSFLSQHMNMVLDAVPALQAWDKNPKAAFIESMQSGLLAFVDSAREQELDVFADVSEQLVVAYRAIQKQADNVSDSVVSILVTAHDQLVDMMDVLAGQQTPQRPEAVLSRLQSLVDELEGEPELETIQNVAEETLEDILDLEQVPDVEIQTADIQTVDIPVGEPANDDVAGSSVQEEDADPELVAIFLDEAMDNLDAASAALYNWLDKTSDLTFLAELQRYLHTIKGGARMAGIDAVGDLGHQLEDVYEALYLGRIQVSGDLINLLLRGQDTLEEMLGAIRSHEPSVPAKKLCKEIRKAMKTALQDASAALEQSVVSDNALADEPTSESALDSVSMVALPQDLDLEMVSIFREEARDLLDEIEKQITGWQQEPSNSEWPELLMRSLHTLKGSARMTGLAALGEDSHNFEMKVMALQEADDVSEADIQKLADIQADIHQSFDAVLKAVQSSGTVESAPSTVVPSVKPIVAESEDRISAPASGLLRTASETRAESSDREMVRVPADLLDQLVNLAGETSISRSRIEQQVNDFGYTLSEMQATIDRLQEQLRRLDIETQAQILSRHEGDVASHPDFDPLEMDQYSELTQLSRSLVESATDLVDLKGALEEKNRDSETLLLQQSRINTELQEGLMRTRMLPFNRMLPRLRRIVRQVSAELDKQVELKVVNAEGEMDRSVMERMIAPLEHMLRNAIDHGIEDSPDVRKAKGKNETGEISLNLVREGGEIVLSLADDGRGLNLDAVRSKAVERGLLVEGAETSDSEISHMIFQPGFSTATNVTQISGRGVGMDVVNSELKQLGGHIEIHTQEDQGTEFEIRLPFTLSVNRALMVNVGEEQFAIPLNTLEGIVRLSPFELESHYSGDDQGLEYAGRRYQLRYLGDLLHNRKPKLVNVTHELPVLLIRSGDSSIAIHVDSLVASREVVVKSLGPQFSSVRGVSGATILGDGRVVVILDPAALLHGHTRQQMSSAKQPETAVVEQENNLVMVVDDSVTVRKVTGRLLKRNGYRTVSARDGVEAMALLQEHKPAVILLDIEMPRMDGFEVATAVRNDPELREVPIIMITSRTGEKHRQRAQEIGVNDYMGKPFQEGLLLETIGGFAKRHDG